MVWSWTKFIHKYFAKAQLKYCWKWWANPYWLPKCSPM
jgi:hypothetical protein